MVYSVVLVKRLHVEDAILVSAVLAVGFFEVVNGRIVRWLYNAAMTYRAFRPTYLHIYAMVPEEYNVAFSSIYDHWYKDVLLPSYRICQQQPYALKEVCRITLAGTSEYNELDTLSYCNEDPNCMNRKSIYCQQTNVGPKTSIPACCFLAHINGLSCSYFCSWEDVSNLFLWKYKILTISK